MRQWKAVGHRGAAVDRLRAQLVAALVSNLHGGPPRPPFAGLRLWGVFVALSAARRWSDAGPDPILPTEAEAWARLNACHLPPHHWAIIAAMDAAWLTWARTPEAERVVGPLTGRAFDAMFG